MKGKLFLTFSFLFSFLPLVSSAQSNGVRHLCKRIYIATEDKNSVGFDDNEEVLICGDKSRPAWRDIPFNQVRFHVRNFLQEQGRFQPEFEEVRGDLIINPGPETHITKITSSGLPKVVKIKRRREILRELLTPTRLNDLENWVYERLQAKGYPCPAVEVRADGITGEVHLFVDAGPLQKISAIVEEKIPGLETKVLRRYDAFQVGKRYNGDWLNLTAQRIEDDGIMQSAHFSETCESYGAVVRQHVIPGPPRLVSVGVGANTEEYLIVRGNWRNSRKGRHGSLVDVSTYGSFRQQRFEAFVNWYFLSPPSRWYLRPLFSISREYQPKFEFFSARASLSPSFSLDTTKVGFRMSFGPELNFIQANRGVADEGINRFLNMQYDLQLMHHYFEFYRTSPRRGYEFSSVGSFNHKSLLSDLSVQRVYSSGHYLWNLFHYDPPLIVLGVRGGLGTSILQRTAENLARLPPTYRFFLGSSADLRGFSLDELPGDDRVALTSIFAGVELRLAGILPYKIQPFVFADFGVLGEKSFVPEAPVYSSPGIGIRWESIAGVFRGTFSHGFLIGGSEPANDNQSHPQFYVSFGEEF